VVSGWRSLAAAAASVREQEQRLCGSPQLQPLLVAHSKAAAARAAARATTATRASGVAALDAAAAAEEAALAEARAALDARSGSLADAAPLIALKRALATLRDDSRELNVRLGVASHALMQARLAAAERGTSAAVASGGGDESGGSDDEQGS
jgi:hypothetical protein